MNKFNKISITVIIILIISIITLYTYLDSQENKLPPLESHVIEGCRNLVRESADIFVQVARDNLQPDNPNDASRLNELQSRILEIEDQMMELGCNEDPDRWTYGSFKQEMSEYEEYIVELTRQNSKK